MTHTGPILEGRGESDYERYVRVPELMELQKEPDQLVHPEELLFQVTHQTAEIWLKYVDYEVDRVRRHLDDGELDAAVDLLDRSSEILDLLRSQIEVLETMAPAHYHQIRTSSLGRGSGQESPGFNRLLDVGDRLWPVVEKVLSEAGLSALEIERSPERHYRLHRLVQSLLRYDEVFMKWRFTHMKLAMRVIGSRVMSLKGVPVTQLEHGTREKQFPLLWDAISDLTDEYGTKY